MDITFPYCRNDMKWQWLGSGVLRCEMDVQIFSSQKGETTDGKQLHTQRDNGSLYLHREICDAAHTHAHFSLIKN